jgi:pimeloyl-ACP methyl ester carboxylesterase
MPPRRCRRPALRGLGSCGLLLALAACGGGSSSLDAPPTAVADAAIVEPDGPGRLESAAQLNRVRVEDIAAAVRAPGSRVATLVPVYEVVNHRLTYRTTDAAGREVVASALASVPVKAAGATSPVLAYQHGTILLDAEAPSQRASSDKAAEEPAVALASQGYIVIAADYVGYGATKGTPHPYMLAAPTAAAVVDLLTAAKTWRLRHRIADNGQLFLAGYSEGGYATLAAQRALQAANSAHLTSLVATAAGGGPYHVTAALDELLRRVCEANPVLGALVNPGLLKHLGSSLRRQVRDALLERLLGDGSDVVFDPAVIDDYLADDTAAIERRSNVHDWTPAAPLVLYHGRDDLTVPYVSAQRTIETMRSRGARDASLTDCTVTPSGHTECVPSFLAFAMREFAARGALGL